MSDIKGYWDALEYSIRAVPEMNQAGLSLQARSLLAYELGIPFYELAYRSLRYKLPLEGPYTSLSHTKGAVATFYTYEDYAVGVDIEESSRALPLNSEKFYLHPETTLSHGLSSWCLKEAAFKALSPLCGELKTLSAIKGESLSQFSYRGLRGEWKVIGHKEIKIALARIKL